ncbi:transketolase [Pseudolabrys sp. Root1462]|uniref:transketolase n=1 Tax=Pseudolabrys sp. Root1462 TaxID=1736466 RepID=UPI00070333E5|nr:transketolase [Pseudolabrys sp. Root1462]KQZ01897.1 transketolase [Pseudolabrys sp. Root1462]
MNQISPISRKANTPDVAFLRKQAAELRGEVIGMSHKTGSAHLASCLSCIDILTAAYWHALNIDPAKPTDDGRDRFILSKGHAAMAIYATLAHRGYFPRDLLETYTKDGGKLAEHPPANMLPGIEAATGSLGHGLPIANGHALSAKVKDKGANYRVFALMSDGECNEGSVWEAAMFASAQKLANLCVIVDYNKWQATARSNETLQLSPLREKWESFGWDAYEIDGHDIGAVATALADVPNGSSKPVAFIANTVKGKGVSFMEDDNNWHYRAPTAEEVVKARQELGLS